jgi:hypothetical protein
MVFPGPPCLGKSGCVNHNGHILNRIRKRLEPGAVARSNVNIEAVKPSQRVRVPDQTGDGITVLDKKLRQMASDEPGASRYENLFGF